MKINKFTKFKTERILLDLLKIEFVNNLFLLRSNDDVVKYVAKNKDVSINDSLLFLHKINKGVKNKKWFYWGIYHKKENKLIGTICLWQFNEAKTEAEIGFELLPTYQGLGYMSEAISPILNFAFKKIQLHKIIGFTHSKNVNSIKLLTKLNFKFHKNEGENSIYYLTT
jgi:ribosomal-protein-alanine N-acetyltransferase